MENWNVGRVESNFAESSFKGLLDSLQVLISEVSWIFFHVTLGDFFIDKLPLTELTMSSGTKHGLLSLVTQGVNMHNEKVPFLS